MAFFFDSKSGEESVKLDDVGVKLCFDFEKFREKGNVVWDLNLVDFAFHGVVGRGGKGALTCMSRDFLLDILNAFLSYVWFLSSGQHSEAIDTIGFEGIRGRRQFAYRMGGGECCA